MGAGLGVGAGALPRGVGVGTAVGGSPWSRLERPDWSGRTETAGVRAAGLERTLKLRVVQTPVGAAAADQLFVSALLNNRAILHHQDQVCLTNS